MTITIIILAYVVNVFLSRWLNKIAYKQTCSLSDGSVDIKPFFWFIPIIPTLLLLYVIFLEGKDNWFTGKNW